MEKFGLAYTFELETHDMNIVIAARCLNESLNIPRFMRCYDFADQIVISDGGSTDNSVELLEQYPKVILHHFDQYEEKNGIRFNSDNPHINFVLDKAKELKPTWIIFDDLDDWPNYLLREQARDILEKCIEPQVNAFRLYCWNEDSYFPDMNKNFSPEYRSLWAWRPADIDIHADENQWHGTIIGATGYNLGLDIPLCLLHKSWNEKTIDAKIAKYKLFGIDMEHPFQFAGNPTELPEWAHE